MIYSVDFMDIFSNCSPSFDSNTILEKQGNNTLSQDNRVIVEVKSCNIELKASQLTVVVKYSLYDWKVIEIKRWKCI